MARKLALEPRHEPGTWVLGDRWRWEETGQVFVLGGENVANNGVETVARCLQLLVEELGLPIDIQAEAKSKRREEMIQVINATRKGKQLDNQLLVTRLNQIRRDS